MFLGRLSSLSLSHNLLDSLAQLAVSSSLLFEVRIGVADPDLDADPDPDPLDPHVFGPLSSLSLSHNLLDSLAQLAVSSSLLLEVRIGVADPDPDADLDLDPLDPHVFGPPQLAQPLTQPPGQPPPAGSVLLPAS
jgi:hypothetical protein